MGARSPTPMLGEESCRHAADHTSCWKTLCDNRSSPDNTIIPEVDSRKDHGVRANPTSSPNFHWRRGTPRHAGFWRVVRGHYFHTGTEQTVIANMHAIPPLNVAPAAPCKRLPHIPSNDDLRGCNNCRRKVHLKRGVAVES